MTQSFRTCAFLACLLSTAAAQQQAPAPAPVAAPKSVVYTMTNRSAVEDFRSSSEVEHRMVNELVEAVAGQKGIGRAWSEFVKPSDRVGIKVTTVGGQAFSSHRGVVSAIVSGLVQAGVPLSSIIIWDRQGATMRAAGYLEQRGGCQVRSIDSSGGFDPGAKFTAPVLGLLIWGDVAFMGGKNPWLGKISGDSSMSTESHLARILTRDVTKIVNVPTFSDERGCGVAGALYNVTVPNIDNWRRFTQGFGTSSICDLYADARIGPKVAITILDGLLAQYAGGPEFDPQYSVPHGTIYASRDPVALDSTVLRKLEGWRKQGNLPPIGEHGAWIQEAQTIGLGNFDPERITVMPLSPTP